jgi:hypothetical protein
VLLVRGLIRWASFLRLHLVPDMPEPQLQTSGRRSGGQPPRRPPKTGYGRRGDDFGPEDSYDPWRDQGDPRSGFIAGFIDTSGRPAPQRLDDMSNFDPLRQMPPARMMNNSVANPGSTADSRVRKYGSPNMGTSDNPYSRRNEMPSRDEYLYGN